MKIYVFTDGASKGNPGPGGWGAVVLGKSFVQELGGREVETTNNRMELSAALGALNFIDELEGGSKEVMVFSDSSYLINGITKWIFGWQKNGWRNSNKDPVLNVDLWQALSVAVAEREIVWKYVPGHSDVAGNERANDIAEGFALKKDLDLFSGKPEDYAIDLLRGEEPLDREGRVSGLQKNDSKKSKGKKAFSYVSMVEGEIEVHKTWDECKGKVSGKRALYKKAATRSEEEKIIAEFKEQK